MTRLSPAPVPTFNSLDDFDLFQNPHQLSDDALAELTYAISSARGSATGIVQFPGSLNLSVAAPDLQARRIASQDIDALRRHVSTLAGCVERGALDLLEKELG